MDIKLKNIKIKAAFSYGVTIILFSMFLLSLFQVGNNLRFLVPERLYTETELNYEIGWYKELITDYSLYYKSPSYSKNESNITKNDINICKNELNEKAEMEYQEFQNSQYNLSSFNELDYDVREEILYEERKAIFAKYNLTGDELNKYILNRKSNSERSLYNDITSYVNISYAAYDENSDTWIGANAIEDLNVLINNSRYLSKITVSSDGTVNKEYVNGKPVNWNSFLNRFISQFIEGGTYRNVYYGYETTVSETKYDSSDNIEDQNITIYTWIPKKIESGDAIYDIYSQINNNIRNVYFDMIMTSILFILFIISFIYVLKKKEKCKEIEFIINKIKKIPLEINIIAILLLILLWDISGYTYYYNGYLREFTVARTITASLIIGAVVIIITTLFSNYKEKTLFKNNISKKVYCYMSDAMKRGSIVRTFIIMTSLYIAIGLVIFFITAWLYIWPIGIIAGIILTLIYVGMFIKDLIYLDKIMVGAKEAAEGKLNYKIVEKGRGHVRELAHDINNIKDGLKKSIQNEVKSENMKTELITNVSHDLKTPLTSIINYIDLLKREKIEPENARDYVDILDRKSQRLKILIEDLFEASKAASGAMELNISKIDVGQLLNQVLGENDERFNESNLRVKLNMPEEKIFIDADGKRMYRVFENLVSNIAKYSLSNTRVFIELHKKEKEAIIIMKNISSYELDFDTEDITNRFKRGDASRSTDGSGLGLAIAKSIVELHGGNLSIEVDGDLFKSIIRLKCY